MKHSHVVDVLHEEMPEDGVKSTAGNNRALLVGPSLSGVLSSKKNGHLKLSCVK